MIKLVDDILCNGKPITLNFSGDNIYDALCFGFSYVESEDHIVNYIVANNIMMKKILILSEAILNPASNSLGELWTAKLLVSNKIGNNRILLSNASFSTIINLNKDN